MKKILKDVHEYGCLASINSLYIESLGKDGRYSTDPCCLYLAPHPSSVDSIEKLLSNPTIDSIRQQFKDDWKRPECTHCVRNEEMGIGSHRLYSLRDGYDGVIRKWDIRPESTCNLKCAMCNDRVSSKWKEDIDILTKYGNDQTSGDIPSPAKSRKDFDFDWVYTKCVDTAEFIYIAGGEPFYMKSVQKFLNKLSKNQWNCDNTRIQIATNGVSNTPKFLDILSRFKRLEFSLSVDGWGKVNEIIRFPTDHNTFIENVDELIQLNPFDVYFNITVQCMNLPNIDELVSNIKNRWGTALYNCHENKRNLLKANNIEYTPILFELHKLEGPNYLRIDNLKPHVVERVFETTDLPEIKKFCSEYKYDESQNKIMQNYLLDLDVKRKTNSKEILGWCFE